MKKVVVFSGAGLDKESGVLTFRDVKDGMWNNYKVEDVATPQGWKNSRDKVLDFYNERRREMPNVEPNPAHLALSKLEKHFDVTNITQNVSDLLERGGSTNVIHLHGELTKARGCYNNSSGILDIEHKVYDIGYNDIENGDKCEKTGSQLRPHIVWFNEMPFRTDEAYNAVHEADILIIVGTSLQISYTLDLLTNVRRIVSDSKNPCKIYYVDPSPMHYLDNYGLSIEYIVESASKGITELVESLISKETEKEVG